MNEVVLIGETNTSGPRPARVVINTFESVAEAEQAGKEWLKASVARSNVFIAAIQIILGRKVEFDRIDLRI